MNNHKILVPLLVMCFIAYSYNTVAQNISGQELLNKSIQYHDPNGKWKKGRLQFMFSESRPDGSVRKTKVRLNNRRNRFQLFQERDGDQIFREVRKEKCTHKLNGSAIIDSSLVMKYKLDCAYTKMIRGYYTYLWGLSMKLTDEGTIVHEKVDQVVFQGKEALALKVTYEEAVGDDIWYFYFDPNTYGLIGYRFYHDESKNDGEYITLEGEVVLKGMRIPKIRKWYYNKDDKFLGTDTLDLLNGSDVLLGSYFIAY